MLMHEAMVAESLLAAISSEAAKYDGRPIAATISCSQLYAINDEILCFAFEAIAKETPCEAVRLQIEHRPARGRCKDCGKEFDVELSAPRCPQCGTEDFELLDGEPLLLEEIEFDTE